MNERGFSLTEVLCALVILSVALSFLGRATGYCLQTWARVSEATTQTAQGRSALGRIPAAERRLKSEEGMAGSPVLKTDSGHALVLAGPRIDEPASCEFDPVGKRCR